MTGVISYSTPTNLIKFNLNPVPGVDYAKHLNNLVSIIGDQKAVLAGSRYSKPDFVVMSHNLNNEISKAEQFALAFSRQGTGTDFKGDFAFIKGLPVFECDATNALGDMRILVGRRGLTSYTIVKPHTMTDPFESVGASGRPTGQKMAYGEEYNAIFTPVAVRNRYTSVLVYDAVNR